MWSKKGETFMQRNMSVCTHNSGMEQYILPNHYETCKQMIFSHS